MRPRSTRVAALAALALAAGAAPAAAHVTVVPKSAPAGAYAVLDVRVPNERDDAATVKVDLKLPPGFTSASFAPVPGWDVQVIRERLARPIETENGPISEQVSRVVWSGGEIPPGAFQDFPLSVKIPDREGETLTFKALQTYAGGEVVRWIGAPDADLPAAHVAIAAAEGEEGDGAGAGHGAPAGEEAASGDATAPDGEDAGETLVSQAQVGAPEDDDASKGLAIAGLAAGVAGLLLGAGALVLALGARRRGGASRA